jgi:hypothetical protein
MTEFKYFRGEGYIDDKKPEEFDIVGSPPANDTAVIDKLRANIRWELILQFLKETGAVDVTDVVVTTADRDDVNVDPTQLAFTVQYRADQVVWMHDLITAPSGLTVYGPATTLQIANQPGVTYTNATEVAVIERAVASALVRDKTVSREHPLNENVSTEIGFAGQWKTITVAAFGTGATPVLRMANIESVGTFTVTQLAV